MPIMPVFPNIPHLPNFNILIALISMLLIVLCFALRMTHFVSTDSKIPLLPYIPHRDKSTNAGIAWIEAVLFIRDFLVFDAIKNIFIADIIIQMKYDPTLVSFEVVDKFQFEKGEFIKKTAPLHIQKQNNFLTLYYDTRVSFASDLDYKCFPFDDHQITFTLSNVGGATANEVMFDIKNSSVFFDKAIYTSSWHYIGHTAYKGFSQDPTGLVSVSDSEVITFPQIQILMDFKGSWRKILVIFIPLFLLAYVGAFALVLNVDTIGISLGSISGILAHRFIVESISPSVGYFTISDRFYLILLISVFIFFLITVWSTILNLPLVKIKFIVFLMTIISWNILTYWILLRDKNVRNRKFYGSTGE